LAIALALSNSPIALAQGGPPFRTDDPETPGNRQWEINLGFIGAHSLTEGSYSTPNLDINYGLGDRIQLKYEIPLNIQQRHGEVSNVAVGLGNSLMGVKWRFYETRTEIIRSGKPPKTKFSFGMSIYPQLALNHPTGSVRRGIADPGPQFLLPLEVNATFGPIQVAGEFGYGLADTFENTQPNSWIRGIVVGHEFKNKTELYLEVHDEADVDDITRESTIGIGGRLPVARHGKVLFLGMVGRSFVPVTPANNQPNWIAYFGLQFQLGSGHGP
jgi:hypothetical protein